MLFERLENTTNRVLARFHTFLRQASEKNARPKAPIPNRPAGWVYDPRGAGFVNNPIEVQGTPSIRTVL